MLTPTAAAVKFDLPSTPEQQACSNSIGEGLNTFWTLVEYLENAADQQKPIHQVEETHFPETLGSRAVDAPGVLGHGWFWRRRSDRECGGRFSQRPGVRELPRLEQARSAPLSFDLRRDRHRADLLRPRPGRSRSLDAQLHLPRRQYSYLLQQWLGSFVVDDAHAEAIRKLGTISGLEIAVKASEDLNREQGMRRRAIPE